ncbi:methionine--tRNA ligase [Candidatus Nomurabacteria bacterium RIFCSPHIGHO2_02_FULL_33_12]|uniref:Methionine--tRNA ligase n=1 Tax=Candidatus Nomurabacteria bacterium RIFCSPLOWO2_01_FULL_33_17 TaxID=1801764 RepID=A0A1F6WQU7_9BACT|nr:MAG: methionine--tRNA ligase [Candidatus Nomurabacteria bacterium RIFCSPHIGHO2_02_FULL_33_12]OGI84247.1 MAG: methionine--tRNA ligase [Candidatus Nomurabacteria bacterium RIFCSPLOWO2_01_FULL_33_17]
MKPFYITTTLPYVNAPLHMGHALEFIRADTIARYKKSIGFDVFFNTGTDEHGIKIYEKAREAGLNVQDFVDSGFETFKKQLEIFGISSDAHFIRTTDKKHEMGAQEFWKIVYNNGYIYKKNYEAKYCVGCESEKTDSELNDDGFCPDHLGVELQKIEEENYFFKYSEFGEKLLEFYEKNSSFIIPDFRFNEIKNFVSSGLQDFSISRKVEKMPWGIPVPGDDTQVMYVWFDALTNYINTLGWGSTSSLDKGRTEEGLGLFEKYWVNGTPTQYCGKDNTRFQGAMWQAMLMAASVPNSYQIVVNGFITGDAGIKMSKTLGNVVDPRTIVEDYNTDALRYFLLREISNFEDSPFTIERFKDAYNSGLANGLGNLTSRILTLSEKYLDDHIELSENLISQELSDYLGKFEIKHAMDFIWDKIQDLDKKIQESEPFKVVKVDEQKGKELISEMVLELYNISEMLKSFLPETSQKIQELIKQNKKPEHPLFLRKE